MSPPLLAPIMFLTAVFAILGLYSIVLDLFLRDRSRIRQRVEGEFGKRRREQVRRSLRTRPAGQVPLDTATADAEPAPSPGQRLDSILEQSGVRLTLGQLLLLAVGLGVALGLGSFLLRFGPLLTLAAGLGGAVVPILYVYVQWQLRLNRFLRQLPDAFDLMARVLRAGHTMPDALQAIGEEFDPPISTEFSYCYEQQNLGLPMKEALRDLARRSGLLEIKILVLALLVQQQTGGNLAQLLENLAGVVRDRLRLRSKIQALTAEGRLQAAVLLGLPPLVFMMLLIVNPSYTQVLLEQPQLLAGMGLSMAIGAAWIHRIVHFDC